MPKSNAITIERDVAALYDRVRGDKQDMNLYVTCRCKVLKSALGCGWPPAMEARIQALEESTLVKHMQKMWSDPQ